MSNSCKSSAKGKRSFRFCRSKFKKGWRTCLSNVSLILGVILIFQFIIRSASVAVTSGGVLASL